MHSGFSGMTRARMRARAMNGAAQTLIARLTRAAALIP